MEIILNKYKSKLNSRKLLIFFLIIFEGTLIKTEEWRQEIGSQMTIGPSESGYREVVLHCGEESMRIQIDTEQEFEGMIYTRGSYHKQEKSPCRIDAQGGLRFNINFNYNECDTKMEGDVYRNVLVVQHDDELVLPGDAAFTLECDLSKTRDLTVTADLKGGGVKSKISLTDPDPASSEFPNHAQAFVENEGDHVSFRPKKDEL